MTDALWKPPSSGEAVGEYEEYDPSTDLSRDPTMPLPSEEIAAVGGETAPGETLLEVSGLTAGYGGLQVLHGIDFTIRTGETAVLLGLNGAGKTTTASVLCGKVKPTGGTVSFEGRDASKWSVRQAVSNGIVMCPEGRRVFPQLSVRANLDVGGWTHRSDGYWMEQQREKVYDYFPRLRERHDQMAGTLSGGAQQMVAIGRSLMAKPKLLIIDEASMGLAPVIVKDVFEIVRQINADGTTVILIEQNIGALDVATLGLIMEQGTIVQEVRGAELADPENVRKVFLG